MTGSTPELFSFDSAKALQMSLSNSKWSIDYYSEKNIDFEYSYILLDESGEISYESGPARKFIYSPTCDEYFIMDEWKSYTDESPFLSTAFKKVFYNKPSKIKYLHNDIVIRLSANNIPENGEIAICGNSPYLGNWKPELARRMKLNIDGNWEISFRNNDLTGLSEYKFIQIIKEADKDIITWEDGSNRKLDLSCLKVSSSLYVNHYSINLPAKKTRLSGTAIPVFSIRSDQSSGIGDFMDLIKMVDFLHITGQNVLQLLPVNDTTMTHTYLDSYPYGAISIYALHPLYLNLKTVGTIDDSEFVEFFDKKTTELNNLDNIDYEEVAKIKWSYISRIFRKEGKKTLNDKNFKSFLDKNKDWLVPYAAFCFLRDKYKTADFEKWPEYSVYKKEEIENLASVSGSSYDKISVHYFVQYHLDKQLSLVHDYANKKRIILKGDIPIGVNKNSVETWVEPYLFNFHGQAGAPPDDFSVKGQNWGFPTYNWKKMESDGYSWWKKRFRKMSEYFDAYRIDHILGFFRIWEIPTDSIEGLMGHFNPALPYTAEEIRSFGYQFNFERDCKPYIKEWVLDEFFGGTKEYVKTNFLNNQGWENYILKDEFNTQAKIENFFALNDDTKKNDYKNALFSLCSDLLFIQDPVDPAKFHPRISAQFTKSYKALDNWQKERFNRIYNYYFYKKNDNFWYNCAMKKLPSLISSTGMLVCGEDLGMIPSCVPAVMNELSILTLEIQRMPKDPKVNYANPAWYPYLSVCTTGTHDTSTLRSWWEEDVDASRDFFKVMLGDTSYPPYYCEPWLCKRIIETNLNSPSMLAILPFQDWLSISGKHRRENPNEERINIPSNPKHYWRYRIHLNIDELIDDTEFTTEIKTLIENTGRIL